MNPINDHRPPPGPPNRPSYSCDLHPTEKFNGFCPSCLCDRLTTLNPNSSASASATSSLFRRTKSFSTSSKQFRVSSGFEPQRRSCDVRVGVVLSEETRARNYVGQEIIANKDLIGSIEEESRVRSVPIEVGTSRNLEEITKKDLIGSIEEEFGVKGVPIEVGKGRDFVKNVGEGISAQTLGNNVGEIGVISSNDLAKYVAEGIRARTVVHNVGEEVTKKDSIGEIVEESGVRGVLIEVGRARNLTKDGGEGIRARTLGNDVGEEIIKKEGSVGVIEEKSGVRRVPIDVGGARILAKNDGKEIRAQTVVNNLGEGIRTLAQNVGDRFRDGVSNKELSSLFEDKSKVRALTEVGRARTLGHNVSDKIRAFEEQIAPIEGQLKVKVPKEKNTAQTLGEIRPFEEKIRISVPIEASGNRTECHNAGDEIMVLEEHITSVHEQSRGRVPIEGGRDQSVAQNVSDEIKAFVEDIAVDENTKSMRHHIDLDFDAKKKKPSVGFWSAASVFSKKWNKWMKKQKAKKQNCGMEKSGLPLNKPTPWRYRETQSEVADYGFGRRSCDTNPRFSIDIGRCSVDGPRPSFDPPRASWDGHMIRRNMYSDHRTPFAEPIPGNMLQTHQYYLDTSSRRRRSFDRSGLKNSNFVIGGEVDETKLGSNAKVTPETFDYHQRKSNSKTLRDECAEIFELGIRDDGSIIGSVEEKCSKRRKKWSFWGLINRRNKYNEDDRSSIGNSFDKSSSARGNNRNSREGTSGDTYMRSSSVSMANSYSMSGLNGNMRFKNVGGNGNGRKKKDEFILERNRSVDNGLLRFYLTPPRSENRVFGSRKSSGTDYPRSISKSVYRY